MRIAELQGDTRHETQVHATDIAAELCKLGFASLSDVAKWSRDGFTLKGSEELPPDVAAAVEEVLGVRHGDSS